MGKGSDPQDPTNKKKHVTTVDDPSTGEGATSGSSAEGESEVQQWRFVLVDTTSHASSLQAANNIEGVIEGEKVQVRRLGVLMGFAPDRIARKILKARHLGSDLNGEVKSAEPESIEVVLRLL